MIFSLIAAGTVTAAQLFAQGVTTSVVTYSIAKTGNRVRILIWQYIYKIIFLIIKYYSVLNYLRLFNII